MKHCVRMWRSFITSLSLVDPGTGQSLLLTGHWRSSLENGSAYTFSECLAGNGAKCPQ